MTLIGFDFSINKPAACVFSNNKYHFYIWPYGLDEKYIELYKKSGVNVTERTDTKDEGKDLSSKMRYEIENSHYLANLITGTILNHINYDTYLSFEGLAYASGGNRGIQLGGYKYILMSKLSTIIPLKNMFTYTPITIKSIAECAKRGMTKKEMITRFIQVGPVCKFRLSLFEHPEKFQKKGGKNWIDNVDDLIDSYWALETFRKKEGI
jgi:hypothetical protein